MIDDYCGNEFSLKRGVRQGDALFTTLFNLILQAVLASTAGSGHIVYKSQRVCAKADDIVLKAQLTYRVTWPSTWSRTRPRK